MKHLKKTRVFAVLVFTVIIISIFSTVNAHGENPVKWPLSDIKTADWFYNDVKVLFDKMIIAGYPDGSYLPNAYTNKAEALKLIMGASGYNVTDIPRDRPWYSNLVEVALKDSIITEDYEKTIADYITRYEVADLLVKALKLKFTPDLIGAAPFIDTNDRNALILNKIGVFLGEPSAQDPNLKNFCGERGLRRSELASVVLRTMKYMTRKNSLLGKIYGEAKTEFGSVIDELSYVKMYNALFSSPDKKVTITITGDNVGKNINTYLHDITDRFNFMLSLCAGTITGYNSIAAEATGRKNSLSITLTLVNKEGTNTAERLSAANDAADKVFNKIWENIPNDATQKDMAKALLDYIVLNCSYAVDAVNDPVKLSEASDAYACLVTKSAVCSGYTAAYNLLLKRAGITCVGCSGTAFSSAGKPGESHIWTIAKLDGEYYYIDSTWCDPIPDRAGEVSYKYFLAEYDSLWTSHYPEISSDELLKYAV